MLMMNFRVSLIEDDNLTASHGPWRLTWLFHCVFNKPPLVLLARTDPSPDRNIIQNDSSAHLLIDHLLT